MPPNVSDAQFLEPDPNAIGGPWALMISAQGDGFEERAVPLQAVVGTITVQMIIQAPDGNGFTGFLATNPAEGDVLSVGYEDLAATPVVFHAGGVV
jgi:hypothetical protein